MGMAWNRPAYDKVAGLAVAPQAINNAQVDGVDIKEPWSIGRMIWFLISMATIPAATQLHFYVYGKKRSDSSYVRLKDVSGNDLEIPIAKLATAGAGSAATLFAGLDLSRVDSTTYSALRVSLKNDNATAQVGGCTYEIGDLTALPSSQVDDTIELQPA